MFAALAVSRHLQDATETSIKNIVQTLRAVRSATIRLGGQEITLDPDIPAAAQPSSISYHRKVTKQRHESGWGENAFARIPVGVVGASIGQIGTAVAQQSPRGVSFCNARQMTAPEVYIHFSNEVFPGGGEVAN